MPLGGVKIGKLPSLTLNKGSRQAHAPSRGQMAKLLGGSPTQRSLGNYAKLTPTGATAASVNMGNEIYQGMQDEDV